MLSEAGTTVGVVGDIAQSIFGFNGAGPEPYKRFNPPGCVSVAKDVIRGFVSIESARDDYGVIIDSAGKARRE
jgi:hypothetical protein